MKRATTSFVLAGALCNALPAYAADDGLPQFNTALFPEQLFWLAVSFGALYLVMHFLALPGVQRVQDRRGQVIESALTAARAASEQAKAIAAEAEKAVAEARAKANLTINDLKQQTAQAAAEQQAAQAKQLTQKLRAAEGTIGANRQVLLQEIEHAAGDMATLIVEQVAGLKVKA